MYKSDYVPKYIKEQQQESENKQNSDKDDDKLYDEQEELPEEDVVEDKQEDDEMDKEHPLDTHSEGYDNKVSSDANKESPEYIPTYAINNEKETPSTKLRSPFAAKKTVQTNMYGERVSDEDIRNIEKMIIPFQPTIKLGSPTGIIAIFFSFFFAPIGFILAIISLSKEKNKLFGIIALVISVITMIVWTFRMFSFT